MKNAKKIFSILLVMLAVTLFMAISISAAEHRVATESEWKTAYAAAQDGDTILFTADIEWGSSYYCNVEKAITVDLGGNTLTTTFASTGFRLKNSGSSLINGTLKHTSTVAALKLWNADRIEDVVIECTYNNPEVPKVIGGIAIQNDAAAHINLIKNVEIKGTGVTNGIEVAAGHAQGAIVDLMENVTIDATGSGLWIYGQVGTVKNCTISGDESGVKIETKNAGYTAAVSFVDCDITGGTQALLVTDAGVAGTISVTSDSKTTFTSDGGQAIVSTITSNSTTTECAIAGFVQNANGTFTQCTDHTYAQTSRVEPQSTTVPGKVVFTCSKCKATDEKDIKLFEFNSPATYLTAYKAADEYDILRMTADTTFDQMNGDKNSSSTTSISKAIVIDLNGKTLTTTSGYGGIYIGGGASLINGTIIHTGNTCAIKAANVDRFEDLVIKVQSSKSDTGGISTRNNSGAGGSSHINVIKNVKLIGTGNYGIETYQTADSTKPIIDLIENCEIDSMKYGIDLRFPLGTIKNSTISGSVSGIGVNGSNVTINFVGENKIMGDESAFKIISGNVDITADKYTNFINAKGDATVFDVPAGSAASSSFDLVGYTVEGNVFTECDHESTGGSCTVRAECSKCTKVLGYVHNYVEDVSKREAPDCTIQGKAYFNCACGATAEEFIARDPNAHVWLTETVPATCTVDGSISYNCKYGSCVGEERVDPIVAPGHDIIIDIPAVPATCTETGLTSAEHCSRCDEATITTQRTVPALGHDIVMIDAVAATCTATGLTGGQYCSRGCADQTVEQQTTPVLGHDIVIRNAVAATCTSTGLTEGKYCSRGCDDQTVTQTTIAALGHDIVTDKEAVAPGCTTTGLTAGQRCTRCTKATVTQQEVAALGHSWVEATTEAPRTCTNCGTTQGVKLPAPAEDPKDDGASAGKVVAIVSAAVVALGGGGFSAYWFLIKKKK